ncbi:MAG: nucleotidyltransferase domain-containing protein [Candidatus Bathyarchaeia archaeon]
MAHFGNNLVSFVIYGSVARGSAKPDSDIDILIVANALPKSRMERQKIFLEVERTLEPEINDLWGKGLHIDFSPIILSVEEARRVRPIYLDMVEDAVIIYDKGDFFKGGA